VTVGERNRPKEEIMSVRSDVNPAEPTFPAPGQVKPELAEHEVRCGMCARNVEVDEETYQFVSEAIKSGLDNPFRCEICKAEYDDLVYEG